MLITYNLTEQRYNDIHVSKPTFIWFRYINQYNQSILHKYYTIPCKVKSILLNIDCICDKYILYQNMARFFPKEYLTFMTNTFKLETSTLFSPGSIYITRPISKKESIQYSSGTGIVVYDSEETLALAKQNLLKYDTIISSEYIKNPLLFGGKKMHLRCHMIATLIHNNYSVYTYDNFKITVAKEPYTLQDFQNKDIHDTHYLECNKDLLFPNDFTTANMGVEITPLIIEDLFQAIREICKKMAIILQKYVKRPPNAANAFHLFGFDILIDNTFNCYLLECNRYCDITTGNGESFAMERFFQWINDIVLKPAYKKTDTVEPSRINTPVYTTFNKRSN
jgi:hypothetical protein